MEKDQDFVKKVKENLSTWMNEAKQMEATITPETTKQNPSSTNTKQESNGGSYNPSSNQTNKNNDKMDREESPEYLPIQI